VQFIYRYRHRRLLDWFLIQYFVLQFDELLKLIIVLLFEVFSVDLFGFDAVIA